MPTRHDGTISMERIMLVYCIMEEILVNIDEIISEHIIASLWNKTFLTLDGEIMLKGMSDVR